MDVARSIRESVEAVSRFRRETSTDPAVGHALHAVKLFQSKRFSGTYADLLRDRTYASAAGFFLQELYGERDYAQRDEQFARIAGAIERLFPANVARTAAQLAQLHALTEDLDLQMARHWASSSDVSPVGQYAQAWRRVGREDDRRRQLDSVVALGNQLSHLTRTPGLRTMLRMMRAPATAAGLGALQSFLETGFDTFSRMSRQPRAAELFLQTVQEREAALIDLLFGADPVACETELGRILGQAR
jgi:hypothetical protein